MSKSPGGVSCANPGVSGSTEHEAVISLKGLLKDKGAARLDRPEVLVEVVIMTMAQLAIGNTVGSGTGTNPWQGNYALKVRYDR